MKLNAILIALFATAAYAQDGRPNKAQMMALREEMRNAKTDEELMAIREKLKDMHPGIRSKLMKDPRMRDRMPHIDMNDVEFDHKAMRAEAKAFMQSIKDITDSEERKKLLRAHKIEIMSKFQGNRN